ncbi:MAG: ligase-associated DNA damage response endonuclease PdeM [Rhodospirillales bacterium]|nr:ligase-associated DNA damage response endonuclease PdeM [Rhodospirillales bacterium]
MTATGSGQALTFAGEEMRATLPGALQWPAAQALIVADLHLEKGSSFAGRGQLLPPYDSCATLAGLAQVVDACRPRRVVCLGDSFHDEAAASRLPPPEQKTLSELARGRDWLWVAGNHDPRPGCGLAGDVVSEVRIGAVVLRHRAADDAAGAEVSGHWHPKLEVRVSGRRLRGRCFVVGDQRLILPAFGALTGGLTVRDPAIAGLFPNGFTAYVIGYRRIHRLPCQRLGR